MSKYITKKGQWFFTFQSLLMHWERMKETEIHHIWNIRQNEIEKNVMITIAARKNHWKILKLGDEGRMRNMTLA